MKYRRLTKEEFESLHEEFILFLSSNTITGEDWTKIKSEEPQKAEKLLDLFSDIAFQKVLEKAVYVERISPSEFMSAKFMDEEAEMLILRSTEGATLPEKCNTAEIKKALDSKAFELIRGSKKYSLLREQEMFQVMNQNANISEGILFNQLKELL